MICWTWQLHFEKAVCHRERCGTASTVSNFLHHFAVPSLLQGKDLPRYTEKKTLAFSREEISALLAHADRDEADWIQFFLATGVRDQEAAYACWSDVNFEVKTFTVREHLDLGFRPKGREEGSIPIPESLVTLLRERRTRYPHTRLIFQRSNG